jgi:secreted protein with Ig-like and vWFA domain
MTSNPNDYILVIDRSGSMNGNSIQLAREALIILLKSLSEGSTFNIVSFGSNYEFMFKNGSVQVTEDTIAEAIESVKNF